MKLFWVSFYPFSIIITKNHNIRKVFSIRVLNGLTTTSYSENFNFTESEELDSTGYETTYLTDAVTLL